MSRKKNKDEMDTMESAAGVLLSIINALVALVRELGGTFADFHRLTTADGAGDLKAIAAIIARAKKTAEKSFGELLRACQQHDVDEWFSENNFPLEPKTDDEDDWEVCEFTFTDCILREDRRYNGQLLNQLPAGPEYRPCGVRRAMEYVARHPDAQFERDLHVPVTWYGAESGTWYIPRFTSQRNWCSPDLKARLVVLNADADKNKCNDTTYLILRRKGFDDPV